MLSVVKFPRYGESAMATSPASDDTGTPNQRRCRAFGDPARSNTAASLIWVPVRSNTTKFLKYFESAIAWTAESPTNSHPRSDKDRKPAAFGDSVKGRMTSSEMALLLGNSNRRMRAKCG